MIDFSSKNAARIQNAEAKKIVKEIVGRAPISVRRGRGTGYRWLSIEIKGSVPSDVVKKVEDRLRAENICGTYWPDSGPGDAVEACVNWRFK